MKPILCNTEVVQNILAGRQTQDRRPCKIQPPSGDWVVNEIISDSKRNGECCFVEPRTVLMIKGCNRTKWFKPKYQVGDVLYVRHSHYKGTDRLGDVMIWDRLTGIIRWEKESVGDIENCEPELLNTKRFKYCPSIHMPKWAARIFLKVTGVRVERIQDISDDDAMNEGIALEEAMSYCCSDGFRAGFSKLWDSIYPGSWDRNDWVFVYDFERTEKP